MKVASKQVKAKLVWAFKASESKFDKVKASKEHKPQQSRVIQEILEYREFK